MKITVIGLGKIGLPLAVEYASSGHAVVGVDAARDFARLVALVVLHWRSADVGGW